MSYQWWVFIIGLMVLAVMQLLKHRKKIKKYIQEIRNGDEDNGS
jgi:preprotein translocase subunit YajC